MIVFILTLDFFRTCSKRKWARILPGWRNKNVGPDHEFEQGLGTLRPCLVCPSLRINLPRSVFYKIKENLVELGLMTYIPVMKPLTILVCKENKE